MAALSFLVLALLPLALATSAQDSVLNQLIRSEHTGFANLLEYAGLLPSLEDQIQSHGGVTIFAPTDESLMYKTSPALLAYLKKPDNVDLLRKVLLFHIVPERISAFKWYGQHATLEGSMTKLKMDALAFHVSGVTVEHYNAIAAEDGVVHSVSELLVPGALESSLTNFGAHEESHARVLMAASGPGSSPTGSPTGSPTLAPSPGPSIAPSPSPSVAPAPGPSTSPVLPPPTAAPPAPVASTPPTPPAKSSSAVLANIWTALALVMAATFVCML